jgi:hypothetical protein
MNGTTPIYQNTNVPWINNMNVTVALYNANSSQPGISFQATQYCPYGSFITAINGLSGNNYYWALYINGRFAQYGIDLQSVKAGDQIKFVYTPMRDYEEHAKKNSKSHQMLFVKSSLIP